MCVLGSTACFGGGLALMVASGGGGQSSVQLSELI